MTLSGKVRVSRITGQASEKVSDIRSKIEKGLAGPRVYSDSYFVNGRRIFVYPPRQWLRHFARPPLNVPKLESSGGAPEAHAGPTTPQVKQVRETIEMERADPLYWPSIQPLHKGFMRDADLLKRLDVTPPPDEHLTLYHVTGFREGGGGGYTGGQGLIFNKDGALVFASASLVVLQDGADLVAKEPSANPKSGQRFFRGHDEAVSAVTIAWGPQVAPEWRGILAASGQVKSKNAATSNGFGAGGERGDGRTANVAAEADDPIGGANRAPYVCVWDTKTLEIKARLGYIRRHFTHDIASLSFSPTGTRLAVLMGDRRHTLSIWTWEQVLLMCC